MYTLEVDADHCFRVGEQGILVHNASGNASNPNIVVDTARTDSARYRATDCTQPTHFIEGTLAGGALEFTVVASTAGLPSGVSGQDFFAAMIAHFGVSNIRVIKGHWVAGIDLDSNIDDFNRLTRGGASDTDAAKNTWTGQRAKDYGFSNARVSFKNPPAGPPGQFTDVMAEFTR